MNVSVKDIFIQGGLFFKVLQHTNGVQFSLTAWCAIIMRVNRQSNPCVDSALQSVPGRPVAMAQSHLGLV